MAHDNKTPDLARAERILGSTDFFKPVRTRRRFMSAMVTGGATLAAVASGLGRVSGAFAALNSNPVLDFGMAAVGAERIGITFYSNALGIVSPFGVSGDVAKGTLLNSGHRVYFQAAMNQETDHLATLLNLGLSFPFSTFAFPAGTFGSAPAMLALGEQLEVIFVGAYLGAVLAGATAGGSLGITVAELAAQICGVESSHRVLIRDIAGANPPNDRFYEGTQPSATSAAPGDTGQRSTVYASGDAAVSDLLALGITPS